MTQIYECMFLINNDSVRAGWAGVKSSVTGAVEKHGGKVLAARHWGERRLAYPIRHRNRATYLRAFCDMPFEAVDSLSRDLNISETVLRYIFIKEDEVPAEELELSAAEQEAEFSVPEPPADDAVDEVVVPEPEAAPAPAAEAPAAEKPAEASASEPSASAGEGEKASEETATEGEAKPAETAEPVKPGVEAEATAEVKPEEQEKKEG